MIWVGLNWTILFFTGLHHEIVVNFGSARYLLVKRHSRAKLNVRMALDYRVTGCTYESDYLGPSTQLVLKYLFIITS